MGKQYWIKHEAAFDNHNSTSHKQPGCVWGLVQALNYHHWQPNRKKMINNYQKQHNKTSPKRDSSPKMLAHDEAEVENLLEEKENLFLNAQRPRSRKKKSLKARIKALMVKEKLSSKPNLRRTYSIHHLEDSDDRLAKKQIIFLPNNSKEIASARKSDVYDKESDEPNDVLEIFKVDKGLLIKHLRDADETLANFSRSALGLGLNPSAKFGKSRSFPTHRTSQRRKLKPVKLEDKKIEVWSSFSKEDKLLKAVSENLEGLRNNSIERTHRRSSSLKESLDKYTNLYEKSFLNEPKLHHSKSLRAVKSESEHHVPTYFRRLRSLSNVDLYYSLVNFEAVRDEFSKITANERSLALEYIKEEEEDAAMMGVNSLENSNTDVNESIDITESVKTLQEEDDDVEKAKTIDVSRNLVFEHDKMIASDKVMIQEHHPTLDSDIPLHEMKPHDKDLQTIEGFEPMLSESIAQQETDKINSNESLTKNKKNSDLNYTKRLLDHSGISLDAHERTWHSYDQPLSPRLFEEVEACCDPHVHERKNSTVPEDFSSLWHHQMLFDLVNEKLVEVYDMSLPYYPKALSQNCRVRPFPKGNRIVEEVIKSVGYLLEDQERSLDRVMARDFENDYSWMNLQIESEVKALEIEDIIFEELVEEIIYS